MSDTELSFERDIKPLFRESDRTAMSKAFDLWSLEDVTAHGEAIATQLKNGTMPCDGAWPATNVEIFKKWLGEGALP